MMLTVINTLILIRLIYLKPKKKEVNLLYQKDNTPIYFSINDIQSMEIKSNIITGCELIVNHFKGSTRHIDCKDAKDAQKTIDEIMELMYDNK